MGGAWEKPMGFSSLHRKTYQETSGDGDFLFWTMSELMGFGKLMGFQMEKCSGSLGGDPTDLTSQAVCCSFWMGKSWVRARNIDNIENAKHVSQKNLCISSIYKVWKWNSFVFFWIQRGHDFLYRDANRLKSNMKNNLRTDVFSKAHRNLLK